jgi:ComEC/Rec2-related protein
VDIVAHGEDGMATTVTPAPTVPSARPSFTDMHGPLFGGYVLVAVAVAWLVGIALRASDILSPHVAPWTWLALVGAGAMVATLVTLLTPLLVRQRVGPRYLALRLLLMAGILGAFLALGVARTAWTDPATDPTSVARYANGAFVRLRGEVIAEPDLRDGARLLIVEVSSIRLGDNGPAQSASGRITTAYYGPDDWFAPAYGDTLALSGELVSLNGRYAPPGVVAELTKARTVIVEREGGNPLLARLFELRLALAQAIQRALPEPEAALLIGILLGLKTLVLRSRLAYFTTTGTIHLVVPAGLKVSILADAAVRTLRPFGRWPRVIGSLLAVGAYAAIGGGGPAALRAAIMGALLVLASALGRAYNVYIALALAVLGMTAVEPLVIYDAGFQLTVLATFGLPLLVPPIQRVLAAPFRGAPGVAVIAELLAVTLAAQLATLPVLAVTFHQVSLIAPLANLLTVPLLAPLLIAGASLATLGLTAALGQPILLGATLTLGWIAWPLLWYVDRVIELCAALPFSALMASDVPALAIVAYYAALALAVWGVPALVRRLRQRPHSEEAAPPANAIHEIPHKAGQARLAARLMASLALVATLSSAGAALPALANGPTARLDFLDVGPNGEATLLRLSSGVTVLINGGPDGTSLNAALASRLPFYQRALDLPVLTDPRAGGARGLEDAATRFTVAQAADGGMLHPTSEYIAWLDALRQHGTKRAQIRQGDALWLDRQSLTSVLAPPRDLYPDGSGATTATNDVIMRLETPGLRALLLGAADDLALDALAGSGQPLAVDIVAVALPPGTPIDPQGPLGTVLAMARPRLIVVTNAPDAGGAQTALRNASALAPNDEAANALNTLITRVFTSGSIALHGDANGWALGA